MSIQFPLQIPFNSKNYDEAIKLFHKIKPNVSLDKAYNRILGLTLELSIFELFPDLFLKSTDQENVHFIDAFVDGIAVDFKTSVNQRNIAIGKEVLYNLEISSKKKLLPLYRYDTELKSFELLGILHSKDFRDKSIFVMPEKDYFLIMNNKIEQFRIDDDGLIVL